MTTFDQTDVTFDSTVYTWDGYGPPPIIEEGVLHMAQYSFGAGILWGTPLSDSSGTAISNPTPVQFGALQDVSLDISFENKMLHGSNQFPIAVGRGKGKVSGKAKAAQISGRMWNSIFFGQTLNAGIVNDIYDTVGKAIPATPFTLTVSSTAADATHVQIPNSGTWSADLGVRNSSGLPMVRVASAPTTGQYSVSAGVYVFAAADTGNTVFIDYKYTATSTTATNSTIINQPMGYAPAFRCDLLLPYQGKNLIVSLPQCISTKLSIATKQDDFNIPEFDFEAFADSAGNVMAYGTSE